MRVGDHRDAARIATDAGALLLQLRAASDGWSPDELRGEGDRRSHEFILGQLARTHPGDAVLSEEGALDDDRLEAERVWIVDPLDGTREFGEPERSDWAVHVALLVGGELAAGAVALPAQGLTLSTDPAPSRLSGPDRPPRLVVSRTRPGELSLALAERLDAELVSMGSAGAKAMAVVRGEADVYAHAGGQYEWDSAAPVAVAAAAGLHTSRLDGSKLEYNRPSPWLPDLLICRPELVERVLTAVAGASSGEPPG